MTQIGVQYAILTSFELSYYGNYVVRFFNLVYLTIKPLKSPDQKNSSNEIHYCGQPFGKKAFE